MSERLKQIRKKVDWSGYDRDNSRKIILELLDMLNSYDDRIERLHEYTEWLNGRIYLLHGETPEGLFPVISDSYKKD